jgi:hypothetical protein
VSQGDARLPFTLGQAASIAPKRLKKARSTLELVIGRDKDVVIQE